MIKLMVIMGTRPNFVKCAPLFWRLNDYPDDFELVTVHTGQHYDFSMRDAFFDDFQFPPIDYDLKVGSGTHGVQTGRMLQELDSVLLAEKPDLVLVPGDTNSALAGALAAYKLHMPNGHIEAGMREYTWRPEEMNKLVADHCADFCFCPIPRAVENLRRENIPDNRIFLTGDITYDTFKIAVTQGFYNADVPKKYDLKSGQYALLTMHRAETVDDTQILAEIVMALTSLEMPMIFPVHPRTEKRLKEFALWSKLEAAHQIRLLEPIGYRDFLGLVLNAQLVMTDSSGVLKEAFYARVPCVVIDETTEYDEIFDLGCGVLAGREAKGIIEAVDYMITSKPAPRQADDTIFGNGDAAGKMLDIIRKALS